MVYRHCRLCTVFSHATNKTCISLCLSLTPLVVVEFCVLYHCLPHVEFLSHNVGLLLCHPFYCMQSSDNYIGVANIFYRDITIHYILLHFCQFAFNILLNTVQRNIYCNSLYLQAIYMYMLNKGSKEFKKKKASAQIFKTVIKITIVHSTSLRCD